VFIRVFCSWASHNYLFVSKHITFIWCTCLIYVSIASWMMSIPCFDHGQWALPGVKSGKGRASEYRGKTQRYGCGSKLRKHRIMMIYDDLWWSMMIYDDLWWFMMIYDDLWWFMMIYDDLWMGISNYKVVCVGLVIQMGCYSHPKVSTIPCFFGRELQGTRLLSHPGGHDFLTWYNHIQQINKMGQIKWYNQSAKLDLTSGIGIWTSKKDLAG
jgi:hypothetical protein